ncbi:MAG: hypothetical protein ACREOJ_03910 [Gemmatimonadaceae bacterium]
MSHSPSHDDVTAGSTQPAAEAPRYPVNHVVGIIDTRTQLEPAVCALLESGFLESEINIGSGQADADALDVNTGRTGLAHLAIRFAERLGLSTDEMDTKERYEQALREGHFVVAVLAPSDAHNQSAARILKDHDGRFVNFLGRFTIESLRR